MVKPSDASSNLYLGSVASALDGDLAAVGSNFQKVFVYNIRVNPAQEIAILTSPDSTGNDNFGSQSVAVSKEYGIIVGAYTHDIGSKLVVFPVTEFKSRSIVVRSRPCGRAV